MRGTLFLTTLLTIASGGHLSAQSTQWASTRPLPKPSGEYAVGTFTFQMAGSTRFPDGRVVARPVTVQVWYPARPGGQGVAARYVDPAALVDSMIAQKYQELGAEEMKGWATLRLFATVDASPARSPRASGWPVVAFSHGFGVARANYAALVQDIASRGYVVVAFDHPYGGFMLDPSGRVLQPGGDTLLKRLGSASKPASVATALAWDARTWAAEAGSGVREAARAGRVKHLVLDTLRVGMLGHSLGGAAALEACRSEAMFRACGDLDGAAVGEVDEQGVPKPMLVLLSQPGGPKRAPKDSAERRHQEEFARMGLERDSTWNAIHARHPDAPAFIVKIRGIAHMSFSDAPFLMPALLRETGSTLDAAKAQRIILGHIVTFFDRFVKGG